MTTKNNKNATILKFGSVILTLFSLAIGYLSQSESESSAVEEKKSTKDFSVAHSVKLIKARCDRANAQLVLLKNQAAKVV